MNEKPNVNMDDLILDPDGSGYYIDETTGELFALEELQKQRGDDELDDIQDRLALYARAWRSLTRKRDRLEVARDAEIQRINDVVDKQCDKIDLQVQAIRQRCQPIIAEHLPKKDDGTYKRKSIDVPAIGTFQLRAGSSRLSSDEYRAADKEAQRAIQKAFPECFVEKTETKPSSKDIRAKIEAGTVIAGFELIETPERLLFKPEE